MFVPRHRTDDPACHPGDHHPAVLRPVSDEGDERWFADRERAHSHVANRGREVALGVRSRVSGPAIPPLAQIADTQQSIDWCHPRPPQDVT